MKFYTYIADAKLDRLLAELSAADRERLATEFGLEQRLLDQPEVQRSDPDETRFARAAAVAHHLEQRGATGGLESESAYVAGQGAVSWGRFRRVRGGELLVHESESPVCFGFATGARELVMTGSASRLLAQPPAAKIDEALRVATAAHSWFALTARAADFDEVDQRCLEQTFGEALPPLAASEPRDWPSEFRTLASETISCALPAAALAKLASRSWMDPLAWLQRDVRALPQGRLEFLAKRLCTFAGGIVDPAASRFESVPSVVVASPLYVAMTL